MCVCIYIFLFARKESWLGEKVNYCVNIKCLCRIAQAESTFVKLPVGIIVFDARIQHVMFLFRFRRQQRGRSTGRTWPSPRRWSSPSSGCDARKRRPSPREFHTHRTQTLQFRAFSSATHSSKQGIRKTQRKELILASVGSPIQNGGKFQGARFP